MIRRVAQAAMRPVPLSALSWLVPRELIGFCYHAVCEHQPPHIRHLFTCKTPREFEQDLEFLARRYTPISYADITSGRRLRRGRRPAVIVTFDDGLRESYGVIRPLLLKYGVPAIFFVTTDFVDNRHLFYRHRISLCIEAYLGRSALQRVSARKDVAGILNVPIINTLDMIARLHKLGLSEETRLDAICIRLGVDADAYLQAATPYLSSADIQSLAADGFTIGAHGQSHVPLASMTRPEVITDVVESCTRIGALVGAPSVPYAFPFSGRGISRALLRDITASHRQVGLFFDTRGVAEGDSHVINRVVVDEPRRLPWGGTNLPAALRLSYASELIRGLMRRSPSPRVGGSTPT